ncbi:hypothetical protein [Bradyrhizobium neotropicale]|uniref:hypothetical protein n=1 Tax=Bradyrhizobium neotropicale TaxID=1497615 RepID=UPI001AD6B3D8|nr:hypothetical protein [Bradyrhizobium neotropicale]MBO4220905.1 hypothetical protein [Bradyrhizobium neotropicale]
MAAVARTEGTHITHLVGYTYVIGDDGHIRNRVEIICDDDEAAKRHAKRLVDRDAVELWQEARMTRPSSQLEEHDQCVNLLSITVCGTSKGRLHFRVRPT